MDTGSMWTNLTTWWTSTPLADWPENRLRSYFSILRTLHFSAFLSFPPLVQNYHTDIFDIFVNYNWVATHWQLYSTHLHTNNTQDDTKQTLHRTIQKFWEQHKYFGRVRAMPQLGKLYPGICLTTEEKARKNLSQGSRTIWIYRPNNKNT
jgi:hypothetical protein